MAKVCAHVPIRHKRVGSSGLQSPCFAMQYDALDGLKVDNLVVRPVGRGLFRQVFAHNLIAFADSKDNGPLLFLKLFVFNFLAPFPAVAFLPTDARRRACSAPYQCPAPTFLWKKPGILAAEPSPCIATSTAAIPRPRPHLCPLAEARRTGQSPVQWLLSSIPVS